MVGSPWAGVRRGATFALMIGGALAAAQCSPAPQKQAQAPAGAQQPAARPARDPEALAALERMGTYLRSLHAFELRSDTTMEEAIGGGQKMQCLVSTALSRHRRGLRGDPAAMRWLAPSAYG